MARLRAFGAFWYDFLVGDRWELFLGPLGAIAVGWLLVRAGAAPAVAGGLLVALVLAVGAASLLLASRAEGAGRG